MADESPKPEDPKPVTHEELIRAHQQAHDEERRKREREQAEAAKPKVS